jgi:septin family protein
MGNIHRIFSFTFSENHEASNAFEGWKELKQKQITFNILILGQTESGKSTLLNQIRRFAGISEKLSGVIFYEKKTDNLCFNKTELNAYQKFIDKNVMEATMSCLTVMKEKNLFFDEDQNQVKKK